MLLLISTALILFAGTEAFTSNEADQYLDMTLEMSFQREADHNRIDPLNLDDFKVLANNTNGTGSPIEVDFTHGEIRGLSSIKRLGNCSTPLWNFANVTFTCNITYKNNPYYTYHGEVTYEGKVYHVLTSGQIAGTKIGLRITTTIHVNVPNLVRMTVFNMGDITNESSLDDELGDNHALTSQLRELTLTQISSKFRNVLNDRFQTALGYSIYKSKIPFIEMME